MTVPNWYQVLLLGLAAYRTWSLLAEDTILDGPRRYVTGTAKVLLECPWCSGFWIASAWWGAWEVWPHGSTVAAVPLALSVFVGALGQMLGE